MIAWAPAAWADPMPNLFHSRSELRGWECEDLSMREGARRYPGRVVQSESRAVDPDRRLVVCAERWLRPGVRDPREDAILSELKATADGLARAAASTRPELRSRNWLVEVSYPVPLVSGKLGFAVKNALVDDGLSVSDRHPALAAGDVSVLARLPPLDAWPAACFRWRDSGALGPRDALLAVALLDPRETALHAGLCVDGGWSWLR